MSEREKLLAAAERAPGPIVVVGRPRSGSRLVARLLAGSGLFMGSELAPGSLDPLPVYQRFVAPLITSRRFPLPGEWASDRAFVDLCHARLADALAAFFGSTRPRAPWGWKFCETLFLMPVVKRLLPGARFVHVIRDGRDVCLSLDGWFQLTGARPAIWDVPAVDGARADYDAFCRAVTVGDPAAVSWRGIDLTDRRARCEHRFLLQMQSWVACVGEARRQGWALGDDYVEVRYESLCREPRATARDLLAWVGRPSPAAEKRLGDTVTTRIGRWAGARLTLRERRDFDDAVRHGSALLRELGYAA